MCDFTVPNETIGSVSKSVELQNHIGLIMDAGIAISLRTPFLVGAVAVSAPAK